MVIDYEKIALEYAQEQGYDTIRAAGEKDGFRYFHYFVKATLGHKLGLPFMMKINKKGEVLKVKEFSEIMWASRMEIELNNL